MSNKPSFRCPVCRAAQPLQEECRRCGADLSLVVRAHRRAAYLLSRQQVARANGDRSREQQFATELKRLAPNYHG